jgi:hypothetical protein
LFLFVIPQRSEGICFLLLLLLFVFAFAFALASEIGPGFSPDIQPHRKRGFSP